MLRSQWQQLFWTACAPYFDEPSNGIKLTAFDKEQYPALQQLDDLHYLEILMLAYSIMLADTVSDDFVDEPMTGELLFEKLAAIGNIELGIQVLVQKGWLIGESDGNWRQNIYEVNLKKLVADGLLTSCERPEVSENEILPVEFETYATFGLNMPFYNSWIILCQYIYSYSNKKYDWVVYKNLKLLCHVFMDLWKLSFEELRVLAIASHQGIRGKFTEEAVINNFHPDEISSFMVQKDFETLVNKGLFQLDGFNDEEEYLFRLHSKVYSDLTRYRLHFNKEDQSFTLHPSAISYEGWKDVYSFCLELLLSGDNYSPEESLISKCYPALSYLNISLEQVVLLSYLITREGMEDTEQNKFFDVSEVQMYFFEFGQNYDCSEQLYELWHSEKNLDLMEKLEDNFWISRLTSTYETEHYVKVKIRKLETDGLLLEKHKGIPKSEKD